MSDKGRDIQPEIIEQVKEVLRIEAQAVLDLADRVGHELEKAVQILIKSEGCLHPVVACWCIRTIFTLLLRLSQQKFGRVVVDVRNSDVHEVTPSPGIRVAKKEEAWKQICSSLFPPR